MRYSSSCVGLLEEKDYCHGKSGQVALGMYTPRVLSLSKAFVRCIVLVTDIALTHRVVLRAILVFLATAPLSWPSLSMRIFVAAVAGAANVLLAGVGLMLLPMRSKGAHLHAVTYSAPYVAAAGAGALLAVGVRCAWPAARMFGPRTAARGFIAGLAAAASVSGFLTALCCSSSFCL